MKKKVHVRKGDTVMVMSGRERGKKGKVLVVSPKEGKIIIEGLNMVSKHLKPRKAGDPSGIVKAEAAMYASKVQIFCAGCGKPTRIAHQISGDGTKERICAKCRAGL